MLHFAPIDLEAHGELCVRFKTERPFPSATDPLTRSMRSTAAIPETTSRGYARVLRTIRTAAFMSGIGQRSSVNAS